MNEHKLSLSLGEVQARVVFVLQKEGNSGNNNWLSIRLAPHKQQKEKSWKQTRRYSYTSGGAQCACPPSDKGRCNTAKKVQRVRSFCPALLTLTSPAIFSGDRNGPGVEEADCFRSRGNSVKGGGGRQRANDRRVVGGRRPYGYNNDDDHDDSA